VCAFSNHADDSLTIKQHWSQLLSAHRYITTYLCVYTAVLMTLPFHGVVHLRLGQRSMLHKKGGVSKLCEETGK